MIDFRRLLSILGMVVVAPSAWARCESGMDSLAARGALQRAVLARCLAMPARPLPPPGESSRVNPTLVRPTPVATGVPAPVSSARPAPAPPATPVAVPPPPKPQVAPPVAPAVVVSGNDVDAKSEP